MKGEFDGGLRVESGGIEKGEAIITRVDEQGDFRATEDDPFGPAALKVCDGLQENVPGNLFDVPQTELVVEDVVDGPPFLRFRNQDLALWYSPIQLLRGLQSTMWQSRH